MKKVLFTVALAFLIVFNLHSYAQASTDDSGIGSSEEEKPCNHIWTEWKVIKEATCRTEGQLEHHCQKCLRCEYKTIEKLKEHTWGDWEILQEATCISGLKYRVCTICNAWDEQEIPANGKHQWYDWNVDTKPGCYSDGKESRLCPICSKEEYRTIPSYGGHNWSEWYFSSLPTCKSTGKKTRICKRCQKEETSVVQKIPYHTYTDWRVSKRATVFKSGVKTRSCIYCGSLLSESIPKLTAKVTLKKSSISLRKNKKAKLLIKTFSSGDSVKLFKSNNKKIATVTSRGIIKGKKKGKTKIIVIMKSGAKATCKVIVK